MFTEVEKLIFGELLEQVEQELSNNGCNDFPVVVTQDNKNDLIELIGQYSDDDEKESLLESVDDGKVYFNDWMLISYLRHRITD